MLLVQVLMYVNFGSRLRRRMETTQANWSGDMFDAVRLARDRVRIEIALRAPHFRQALNCDMAGLSCYSKITVRVFY